MQTAQPKPALPKPRRADIFLARLDPIEGSEQSGTRPVVVVTRDAINANSPVVVVVPMTDALNPKRLYPSHVWLPKTSGGLRMDSIAKAEQVRAIAISRLLGYYGRLGQAQMLQIDEAIRIALALS